MTEYTIAAIPTEYRGRRYRSRLEARWAAFFDLLGWRHEYEPFDLGSWSPDFLLPDWKMLVEVKPLEEFDRETWDKAVGACRARGLFEPKDDCPVSGIFLTRTAPSLWQRPTTTVCRVGWFGIAGTAYEPSTALLLWQARPFLPEFTAELVHGDMEGWWTASGDAGMHARRHRTDPQNFPEHATGLWARATNTVQWLGKEARP
jgi:hypothetical protein